MIKKGSVGRWGKRRGKVGRRSKWKAGCEEKNGRERERKQSLFSAPAGKMLVLGPA